MSAIPSSQGVLPASVVQGEKAALALALRGAPVADVLARLAAAVAEVWSVPARCAFEVGSSGTDRPEPPSDPCRWEHPVVDHNARPLGRFVVRTAAPAPATPADRESAASACATAAVLLAGRPGAPAEDAVRQALDASRARLQLIIDSVPGLIAYLDTDGRYTLVNRSYHAWFGPRDTFIGASPRDVLGDRAWAAAAPRLAEALAGEAVTYENHVTLPDGRSRWLLTSYTPDRGPAGAVQGVIVSVTDITDHKRVDRAQRFLLRLGEATQGLVDADAITGTTARLLAEHLDVDRCAYAAVEDEAVFDITGDHTRGVPSIVGRWPVRAFGLDCERRMLANLPYVVHDVGNDPRVTPDDLPAYRATAIASVICVPLHKAGVFTAAMAVHSATARQWSEDEVALVREVVARCWESLERARADRQLRESEQKYRALFESMDEGFLLAEVVRDADGRAVDLLYLDANPAAIRMTGGDYTGRRLLEIDPAYEPHWLEIWDRVDRTGVGERHRRHAAPLATWFDFWVFAVDQGTRGARRVAVVFQDVTAEKCAQDALQQADRRKDEFLATLAHELRNPLAPLRNGLQIARMAAQGDTAQVRTVDMMDRQLTHLVRLVDDLLDVGRISAGKIALREETVSLQRVLGASLELSRVLAESHGQAVETHFPADDVRVVGDPDRLTQVFNNLLSNAAKYASGPGRIGVHLGIASGEAVVRVVDSGIGIPATELAHVFDLFSQVRAHQGQAEGGLGIGLSLVRSLVARHGGTVQAESDGPGCGSTFTVRLPLAPAGAAAAGAGVAGLTDPAVAEADPDDPAGAASGPAAPADGLRILVVDDNVDAAESLAALLELLGHAAWTCHGGADALAIAPDIDPQVVVLDLGMPGMDGLTAARGLRAQPGGDRRVLVAMTGWGQAADKQRTAEAGFDHHLVKPADVDAVEAVLARVTRENPPGARGREGAAAPTGGPALPTL